MTTRHPELGNNRPADFSVGNHGSICLLVPHTDAAREWVRFHMDPEARHWAGGTVVEPRYIDDIVAGIEADGLEVL